ncbi:ATP-dependent endonuclease [Bacillus cereus]|uniref:ATP-dependent nuclease n=2 Tax=Bacillus cereus TaxID=1396 RepID=UPI000BF830EC|nr:AAA family ATPase [Bacillus cereus]PEX05808.1 ATP-dependent endonuclease [Bacillus cereus]PGS64694.1 ATP-dependent endonuclease [Bacillus cereus]
MKVGDYMSEVTRRPRLSKLIIKNFRAIGSIPVEIELDDIVVLVGPNNVGKSSILRAYEVVMSDGSKKGDLTLDDFPNGEVNSDALPEIELHTVVYENLPGAKWVDNSTGENLVRERWVWNAPGKPKRNGYDTEIQDWAEEGVPWGAANVANSRRPLPHKVDAFSDPEDQSKAIIKLLSSIIDDRVKSFRAQDNGEDGSLTEYQKLIEQVKTIQSTIIEESQEEIKRAEDGISELLKGVFPNYTVTFDARPEEDLEKNINLFKAGAKLLMGPTDGYQSTIDRQGSGARRTLLWAALRYVSDTTSQNDRPHVLLLDEPELCLHPSAVREACKVLYDLPTSGNWQVMVTTHSPLFIDVSRDNTTIIRVERIEGEIQGTTVFRPNKVQLGESDRQRLKLLNVCDPHVTEFFFGGHSIIVEGDTEYTAFKYIMSQNPDAFKDVHIIRARGKGTIVSLVKILNHFNSRYSVLHDSDYPFLNNGNRNPAWSINQSIVDAIYEHEDVSKVRLIANLKNFEAAYLSREVSGEKPYNALMELMQDPTVFNNVKSLLDALIDHTATTPVGCLEWQDIDTLKIHYEDWEIANTQ